MFDSQAPVCVSPEDGTGGVVMGVDLFPVVVGIPAAVQCPVGHVIGHTLVHAHVALVGVVGRVFTAWQHIWVRVVFRLEVGH